MFTANSIFIEAATMAAAFALADSVNVDIVKSIFIDNSGVDILKINHDMEILACRSLFLAELAFLLCSMILVYFRKWYLAAPVATGCIAFVGLLIRQVIDMVALNGLIIDEKFKMVDSTQLGLLQAGEAQLFVDPIFHLISMIICCGASIVMTIQLIRELRAEKSQQSKM